MIVLLLLAFFTGQVSAHVLITDTSGTNGSILHITPDDDPVAGQNAQIYFDSNAALSNVELQITNPDQTTQNIDSKQDKTLVTSNYVFPEQGVYTLTYSGQVNGKTVQFEHTQRVDRGVHSTTTQNWGQPLFVISALTLLVFCIVGFNNRKSIARQSKL